jgi:outer membrane biosynthesis protein TonB
MICLFQIDGIVRNTLYNYGLQFSSHWANPYLSLTQIGFTAGWINIIIAFAVQLNNVRRKHKAEQSLEAIEKAREDAKTSETEKAQEEGPKEPKETEPEKSPEEAPAVAPESEVQEKKEEPPQPEQAPEQEPQQPETKKEDTPSLVDLFQ